MDPQTQEKYANNGKVILGSAILLFLIVIIIIFIHTFRHSCFRRRRHHHHGVRTDSSVAFKEALQRNLLNSLPTFTYSSDIHRSLNDCAVCLTEFVNGEQGRILPNCNHAFHTHCIDTWFHSHSNCPLCRTLVHPRAEPVQPYRVEPGPVGFYSFPAPIGCPRKSLEMGEVIVELEVGRLRDSDSDSGHRPV
ncbi:RING-H2 finger protein ATL2-like [Abrus precatorius]|uniref:RING-H2 finger protein ATL2-like n=1 Tax=Abrus precatorius TaxID=3816 RepID=A0A8B8MJ73_ABRPR|nr:RING-H2 finger protein ATL2-like [Abrus precatorius]